MMATESALKQMAVDENITVAIEGQRNRLRNFIRKCVPDEGTVEDILQDVFYEFVQAYRLTEIEQVGAWLFRVAKNRITDFFRTRKSARFEELKPEDVPSQAAGPEDAYLQSLFWQALDTALAELPEEQREVFIAHEFEGRSFRDLAAETRVSMNTLISRKHYAVLHLRERLRDIYEEFIQ
jgi:RNA polymerase sigma factor (sigma-70 family)